MAPGGPTLRPGGSFWLVLAVANLALALTALGAPLFYMQVLDRVIVTASTATLLWLLLGFCIVAALHVGLELVRGRALAGTADLLAARLAPAAFSAAAGAAIQPIRDVDALRRFAATPAIANLIEVVWVPPSLLVLALLSPAYALFAAGMAAVLLALGLLAARLGGDDVVAANAAAAQRTALVGDLLRAPDAVLGLGMMPATARRLEAVAAEQAATRALSLAQGMAALIRTVRLMAAAGMAALGVWLVLAGQVSAGTILAANLILARLLLPFESSAAALRQWTDALAAWRRLRHALAAAPGRAIPAMPRPQGRLVVEALSWRPPGAGRLVLRDVGFTLDPGELVVVLGASGAGKSALLRLVLGQAPPGAGSVTLDGYATHLWDRADLARHVGALPQHAPVFDATLAENIAGLRQPDPHRVLRAAQAAGLHAAASRLSHGYATRLTPFGPLLSEGERQALGLARALYPSPRLLVLDEPDARLDVAARAGLRRAIVQARASGVGVLLTSHAAEWSPLATRIVLLRPDQPAALGIPAGAALRAVASA